MYNLGQHYTCIKSWQDLFRYWKVLNIGTGKERKKSNKCFYPLSHFSSPSVYPPPLNFLLSSGSVKTSTFLSKTCQWQSVALSASLASLRSLWCNVENSFPCWVQFSVAMPQTPEVYPFNVSFSGYPGPQLETSLLLSFANWASNAQLTLLDGMVIQICDALLWCQEDFCGCEAPETSTLSNSSS